MWIAEVLIPHKETVTVNRKTANFGIRDLRNLFANHPPLTIYIYICTQRTIIVQTTRRIALFVFSSEVKRPKIVSLRSENSRGFCLFGIKEQQKHSKSESEMKEKN